MNALGKIPQKLKTNKVLEAIGENIIIADKDYNILWLNPAAVNLLSNLLEAYGLQDINDLIGMNMNRFHKQPEHQNAIMEKLEDSHRATINIKDQVVTDIVIDPIRDEKEKISGYVVMLMDVTTRLQKEEKREQLINELSVPLLHIWDNAIALPLTGSLEMDRFDFILTRLLHECQEHRAIFAVIDLTGVREWHDQIAYQLERMIAGLALMGTKCLIVGISPELAQQLTRFPKQVPVFPTMKAATKFIISR